LATRLRLHGVSREAVANKSKAAGLCDIFVTNHRELGSSDLPIGGPAPEDCLAELLREELPPVFY